MHGGVPTSGPDPALVIGHSSCDTVRVVELGCNFSENRSLGSQRQFRWHGYRLIVVHAR